MNVIDKMQAEAKTNKVKVTTDERCVMTEGTESKLKDPVEANTTELIDNAGQQADHADLATAKESP